VFQGLLSAWCGRTAKDYGAGRVNRHASQARTSKRVKGILLRLLSPLLLLLPNAVR
jgi:hypothetical protein